ncbi:uncharacterized protein LOC119990214 [Tripterygium wilfordii]|uniref:uncharacterized protein LOC119990214 n=1 Tax=Tripterygium wilfordii TaxID=458696 RepID=UPI0018F7F9DC|nr:uncharacterized protein LOC119990214 [Tripterygium wilfordii]
MSLASTCLRAAGTSSPLHLRGRTAVPSLICGVMDFRWKSIVVTAAALGVLLYSLFTIRSHKKKESKYHPIAGTKVNQILNFNRLHHFMTEVTAQHKTYRLIGLLGMKSTLLNLQILSKYSKAILRIMARAGTTTAS